VGAPFSRIFIIMNNPKQTLVIGMAAVAISGAMILFGSDGASPALRTLQYLFCALGLAGVIGALVQLSRR
jgi:hypothetical protein